MDVKSGDDDDQCSKRNIASKFVRNYANKTKIICKISRVLSVSRN